MNDLEIYINCLKMVTAYPFIGQLSEFSQLYINNHNFKYPIEKLHINTQTNQEKGI